MKNLMRKYIRVLKIELDDIEADIELLIDEIVEKGEKHQITKYVLLENLAVLKNEMSGIEYLKNMLDGMNPDDFSDIQELADEIDKRVREYIEKGGLVKAVYSVIERKLHKVMKYIKTE
ncbi:MAG: hypothetical protein JW864_02805 [Spirochaetes bacterium]|nr:hypothetical protein [Spirochaetota bacterium]